MLISDYLSLLSASAGSTGGSARSSSAATSVAGAVAAAPVFGPATQLAVNNFAPAVSAPGYAHLGDSGIWQFDLAGAISPQASGIEPQALSHKQRKAETAALKQAFELIDSKEYDAARELLNEVLAKNRTNSTAVQGLGLIAQGRQDYAAAEQYFLRAHALSPTVGYDKDAANARLLRRDDHDVYTAALTMTRTPTRRDDGIRVLIGLTDRNPEHTGARIALGTAMLAAGDPANGLMQYSTALKTADDGQLAELNHQLEGVLKKSPKTHFARQLLGRVRLKQGRADEALQLFNQTVREAEDPFAYQRDVALAQVGIGRARLKGGDIPGALLALGQAREADPQVQEAKEALAEAYVARAERLIRLHDLAGAVRDYTQAATLLPAGSAKALRQRAAHGAYALGLSVQRKRIAAGGKIESEVAAFQAAHQLNKSDKTAKRKLAETRSALGDQQLADGEVKEAAQSYRRAWELFPHNDTYRDKAVSAFTQHADDRLYNLNYDQAIEAYREAFKIDPTNANVRLKLAGAYNKRGLDHLDWERRKQAMLDFKTALRLVPDNEEFRANYASVQAWDI